MKNYKLLSLLAFATMTAPLMTEQEVATTNNAEPAQKMHEVLAAALAPTALHDMQDGAPVEHPTAREDTPVAALPEKAIAVQPAPVEHAAPVAQAKEVVQEVKSAQEEPKQVAPAKEEAVIPVLAPKITAEQRAQAKQMIQDKIHDKVEKVKEIVQTVKKEQGEHARSLHASWQQSLTGLVDNVKSTALHMYDACTNYLSNLWSSFKK